MNVKILNEADIRACISLDQDAVNAVAEGFSCLAQGKASLPPIMRIDIAENRGEIDVKSAHIHGFDYFAIKAASGFLDNPSKGLPYGNAMMILMSAKTGFLEAVLLDNSYLTDIRTGAAGAIAARHLCIKKIETAGVIGSGSQARYQIRGLKLVRDFKRLIVFGIEPKGVDTYIKEMKAELGIEIIKAGSPEEVVRQSDVVVTTTPSREPYLKPEWLHPGLHITCMGSDTEHKQEVFADVFKGVDRIVCDRKSQCFRLGELHHALEAGVITKDSEIIELGELTSGQKQGRQSDQEITVCDLTGVGVQDTTIALLAYQRSLEKNLGVDFES